MLSREELKAELEKVAEFSWLIQLIFNTGKHIARLNPILGQGIYISVASLDPGLGR